MSASALRDLVLRALPDLHEDHGEEGADHEVADHAADVERRVAVGEQPELPQERPRRGEPRTARRPGSWPERP